ncbi:TMEM175 family protein [Geodermatophilus sp. URMC 64]
MRTERGLDRLVTFLDAVVAIAITLLVLPLAEALDTAGGASGLGDLLSEEAAEFGAFFLSFAVIARLWLAHHRIVEGVGSYDRPFVLLNLLWILTIVVLPFATQVVSSPYGSERLAVLIYIGTITLNSVCLSAISVLVWRRPGLRRGADEPAGPPWPALVTTGLLVVALLLGTLVPWVNYWGMLLLFLSGPVESRLSRRDPSLDQRSK